MARVLTIGQLAQATGVPTRTIRYYEQVGVLPQPGRTGAGYRQYTQRAVDRLLFLRRARALGLSLQQLRTLAHALQDGPSRSFRPRLRELVRTHLLTVEQQIAEFKRLRRQLQHVFDRLAAPHVADQPKVGRRGPRAESCRCLEIEEGA